MQFFSFFLFMWSIHFLFSTLFLLIIWISKFFLLICIITFTLMGFFGQDYWYFWVEDTLYSWDGFHWFFLVFRVIKSTFDELSFWKKKVSSIQRYLAWYNSFQYDLISCLTLHTYFRFNRYVFSKRERGATFENFMFPIFFRIKEFIYSSLNVSIKWLIWDRNRFCRRKNHHFWYTLHLKISHPVPGNVLRPQAKQQTKVRIRTQFFIKKITQNAS